MLLARLISIFCIFLAVVFSLNGQSTREFYEYRYNEKKKVIDSVSAASLGIVGGSMGYILEPPYLGIFPKDTTLNELNLSFRTRAVSAGDTFYIHKITYPLFNLSLSVPDTTIDYFASRFDPVEYLIEKEPFEEHLEKLKALDISYIGPLWGLLYCNPFDDSGPDDKQEKYWIAAEEYNFYFRLSKEGASTFLTILIRMTLDSKGESMEALGCSISDTSSLVLIFEGGHQISKTHLGAEENCSELRIDITDHLHLLKSKLEFIEISLSQGSTTQRIKSKVQADILALKCECLK